MLNLKDRYNFLLSLTDPDILKQQKVTNLEAIKIKSLALEKLHRQSIFKEYAAVNYL